ncbi:UNKNOWN [Stylonychia lemnae]|uniref:LITAF domain-containing protein n=1 Tax=Stylonychia lemnae TaxID=5949 RepID=A0A077ZVW6_STYLE|nr:UNKNOWN [Stylonychia lemnae]|eukprot:CDW74095.1 UNKNOWN [Stylonychia lemnae]
MEYNKFESIQDTSANDNESYSDSSHNDPKNDNKKYQNEYQAVSEQNFSHIIQINDAKKIRDKNQLVEGLQQDQQAYNEIDEETYVEPNTIRIDNVVEGQALDEIEDYEDMPSHSVCITCPFCGIAGQTRVRKDKFDIFMNGFLITLKITLCIFFMAFIVIGLFLICLAASSRDGGGGDCNGGWSCCYFYHFGGPSCETQCCCGCDNEVEGTHIRRIHKCGNCKQDIGYSKKSRKSNKLNNSNDSN